MFEQTSILAEKLATSVSRRGFLGSLGWAVAAALGVAGVLTGTGTARAAVKWKCCYYGCDQRGGNCKMITFLGSSNAPRPAAATA